LSSNDWAAMPRPKTEPELDVNYVFSNFKNGRPAGRPSEAEARDRVRKRGEDRMRGVVVEVRKSKTARQEPEAAAAFRF